MRGQCQADNALDPSPDRLRGILTEGGQISTRTVLLVDDEAAMLRSLARVFAACGWMCVLAATPLLALDALAGGSCDALVSDYRMQPFDGVELCRRARHAKFPGPVVVYSGHVSARLRESAVRAGAHAVVPKDTDASALAQQLAALCELGGAAAAPAQAPRDHAGAASAYARAHNLSPRETQVLECALAGDGREQTAYLIGCKPGTIATHWRRIFNKTGKPTKSDVLADAFRFLLDHGH